MNNLITLSDRAIGAEQIQSVNARELHAFLEVGKDFSNWVKDRIDQYDFVENQDFVCSPVLASEGRGGHNRKDYHLTLDMAKELSMVERNAKGKEARQYFIECERKAKAAVPSSAHLSRLQLIQMAMEAEQEKLALEDVVREQAPKVAAHDRIADAQGSLSLRETAATLQFPERQLVMWLEQHRWVYRRIGGRGLLPYAEKVRAGHLYLKQVPLKSTFADDVRLVEQVRVAPLGLTVLARNLGAEGRQLTMSLSAGAYRQQDSYASRRG